MLFNNWTVLCETEPKVIIHKAYKNYMPCYFIQCECNKTLEFTYDEIDKFIQMEEKCQELIKSF